ncbi:GNAT family N-acetyltransferase [Actinotalea subterranea]|uniref:GNAT family N-acetyltransferase n=1 Tax=Actinotalea subterranea TaxID=2607497 RepID=UPI00165E7744|nr:GNAT family N-acetyltransferase [Actinotalea subterranea]
MPLFADFEPATRGVLDPSVVIRAARTDDVEGVAAVASSRGELPAGFRDRLAAWVAAPEGQVLVGDRGGEVVGWARVAPLTGLDVPDGLYVQALTVAPAHRRRGTADRLLGGLVAWSAERADVLRSVINAGNLPSILVHAQHGFREVARGSTFAGITFQGGVGVLMAAELGEGGRP